VGEIFISYASADTPLAAHVAEGVRLAGHLIFRDSDRENGVAPGAEWPKTLLHELRRCDAVVFLNSSASQASMWCHSELVVATDLGKRVYSLDLAPDVPPHPLLQLLQGIRLETTLDASIQRLTDNLRLDGLAQSTRLKWERGRSPYPGLAAMDVADAGVFFGREDDVRDLEDKVNRPLGQPGGDLVVVMGPSGAGKSSLVRAGLVARLAVPGSGWVVAGPFEPGTRPLRRLASRLAALVPGQLTDDQCRDRLLTEGIGAVGEWLADHTESAKRLLITVDQTEQLATVTPSQDAGEFLTVIGGGLGEDSPVTVVMTVRSDRFDEIQRLPVVGPMIHESSVIAPMGRSQLAAVIEGPAGRADLTFAPGLVARLIDDAVRGSSEEAVDALPFLAFTLREMYDLAEQEDRHTFTDADYERVGRIEGAIIRRTEAAESLLPADSGPVLERLLPRFVTLSEDRRPAGRPVPRDRLTTAEQAIVEKLEDQRLLTGTGDTVRLAHEQLITAWPRLAQTVADRRDDLLLQARIERQANDWKHGHGELLGRDAATIASSWLAERAEPGTERSAIGDYIRASRRALRRRRARLVGALSAVVALAVAASVFAVVASQQRSNAEASSREAIFNQVTAEAGQVSSTDPSLAAELDVLAYQMKPTLTTDTQLISDENTPLSTTLTARPGAVSSVAFSPSGGILAAATGSEVQLWGVSGPSHPRLLGTPLAGPAGRVSSVAFSPAGSILAEGTGAGTQLWDVSHPSRPRLLGTRLAGLAGGVSSVAFSPSGSILASATGSEVQLWGVSDPSHPRLLGIPLGPLPLQDGHASPILSVAFSPDGSTIAAGAGDNNVHLWRVANPSKPVNLGWLHNDTDSVTSVSFSPNGDFLATGSADDTATLWNITNPAYGVLAYPTLTGHTGAILAIAMSPDGHTLATASADHTIRLWNLPRTVLAGHSNYVDTLAISRARGVLASGSPDHTFRLWDVANPADPTPLTGAIPGPAQYDALSFSPDGLILAAATSSDVVQLWQTADPRHPTLLGTPLAGFSAYVATVAFSPDGRTLAAGSFDGTIRLWNVANPAHPIPLGPALRGPVSGLHSVAFSPDGRTLAVGGFDGTIRLWNVTNPAHPIPLGRPLEGNAGSVYSVVFSPDGRTLASGNGNGTVQLWNMSNPARASALGPPLTGHTDVVYSLAFSPDGRTLATASFDETIRLWNVADPASPQAIGGPLTGDPNYINAVVFGSSDNMLVGADGDYTIRIWNLNAAAAIQHICATTTNVLTPAQWQKYVPELPYDPPCGASQ